MIPIDDEARSELIRRARAAFRFLDDMGARVERCDESTRTVFAYTLDRLTLEVELDWPDARAFVLVCRTVNGRRPPGAFVHQGRRVRIHLARALDYGSEPEWSVANGLRRVVADRGPGAMAAQLAAFAAAIRGRLAWLCGNYDELFPDGRCAVWPDSQRRARG